MKATGSMKLFKVVAIGAGGEIGATYILRAATPEAAAAEQLGLDVVRGAAKGAKPVAKVYWEGGPNQTNMVRLYARLGHATRRVRQTQFAG